MRAVLQRVREAAVSTGGRELGRIGEGLLVLLAFGEQDAGLRGCPVWARFLRKIGEMRLFPDARGPINTCLLEHGGGLLIVSQFTLYADIRKGRRPSFAHAMPPEPARVLYDAFVEDARALYKNVQQGEFGADMDVSLVNWGPVTIWLDSADFSGDAAMI